MLPTIQALTGLKSAELSPTKVTLHLQTIQMTSILSQKVILQTMQVQMQRVKKQEL